MQSYISLDKYFNLHSKMNSEVLEEHDFSSVVFAIKVILWPAGSWGCYTPSQNPWGVLYTVPAQRVADCPPLHIAQSEVETRQYDPSS